jgi:hypothetical protein
MKPVRYRNHLIEPAEDFAAGYVTIAGPHLTGGCGSMRQAKAWIDESYRQLTCKHTEERWYDKPDGSSRVYCKRCHKFLRREEAKGEPKP